MKSVASGLHSGSSKHSGGAAGLTIHNKFRAIALLAILLFIPTAGLAQAISGDLTGTITDPSGAAIPAATVIATNDATGVKTTVVTNASGVYRFSNLPVARYTLTGSAAGFTTSTVNGLELTLGNVLTVNMTLAVGAVGTTVEVSAASAVIDTTTAQIQTTFNTQQVSELPQTAQGSGIYNLALMGAGVSTSGGVGQGFGPAISGQRPDNNSFFLDGVSNNNYYNPAPLMGTSNEAIAEFTLLQNQFSPEFGGGSGGIFTAIVKSGTNEVHGNLYEYLQNRKLNAVDSLFWTQGLTSLPRYDNNRLGATIGGPIFKNKLFYFGNFEYNPIGQAAVPGAPLYAPTGAGYSQLGGLAGISKTNLQDMQKYIPAAAANDQGTVSVLGQNIPIGSIAFNNPVYTNNYNALVSIDYNMSTSDQLRGRWIYNKQSSIVAATVPTFNASQPNNNYAFNVSEFHNFSPTLQNEFRTSFSRNFNQLPGTSETYPGLDAFPVLQIDELNGLSWGPVGPSGSIQNLFQVTNNLSKVMGRHTIKVGGDFIDMIASNYFIQRVTGNYEYSTLELFLTDQAPDVLGERSAGATSYPVGFLQYAGYANDDIRLRSNLTLNLGVRYEYATVPVASRYQVASAPASSISGINFGRPYYDNTNFAPRLGFAYSPGPTGAWSIRGGFAQAYDLVYSNLTSNAAPPYFQQTNDCPGPKCAPTGFLASGGLPGTAVPLPTDPVGALGPIASYTFGGKRPYGLTWTLGVQHVFAKDYTLEVRYTGTRGVHLWNQTRLNVGAEINPSNFIPTYFSLPSAATLAGLTKTLSQVESNIVPCGTASLYYNDLACKGSFSNIVGYAPQATSTYHGLAVQLNRRFAHGLSYIAAYTWSHNEDDATATNFSTYLTPRRAQDFQNLKADWSTSALDRRQRFTFTPIYEFRPFKGGNWFMKNLVGNWNISGTYTYESPEFATVQSGIDSNRNGDSAGDRVITNPAGAGNLGSGVTGYSSTGQPTTSASAIVAYVANNPNARYVVAGVGALANSGRNTFPLHPINNIDFNLKKRFTITEHRSFDVGASFYNLLNHAQYTGGYLNDVASRGYTNARNDLVPSDPLFGRFDQFYSSNSRFLQIFAHFTF
ncbi:MAG TPA: TonB-dependent receptor [Bryobacteraceae bacterium]|nr:TonB-dependent receptor [Bryobacteraceae bacterium]